MLVNSEAGLFCLFFLQGKFCMSRTDCTSSVSSSPLLFFAGGFPFSFLWVVLFFVPFLCVLLSVYLFFNKSMNTQKGGFKQVGNHK